MMAFFAEALEDFPKARALISGDGGDAVEIRESEGHLQNHLRLLGGVKPLQDGVQRIVEPLRNPQ